MFIGHPTFFCGHRILHTSFCAPYKKLKDLAEYIYETESLYIAKHGGFKLLEISSIETKLCNIRQEERERKEEEEKQVKKRVENKR